MKMTARHTKIYSHEALMRYARQLGFGDIHYRLDPKTKLNAIIAVHNTVRGPAIGGCRFYPYRTYAHALKDVLRLSSMMTVKNAACGLPHGGAKSVIITPPGEFDRKALFNAFGDFVNDLGGTYITAMDVGTTNQDMDDIAERTPHVIGSVRTDVLQEDPSPYTAKGVLRGIQAAVRFKLKRESLENLTVAIQGAGKVGSTLARLLYDLGARVTISDVDQSKVHALRDTLPVKIVSPEEIMLTPCEVFSPCALGGTLTHDSVAQLNCDIIAGCANNQLAHRQVATQLQQRDILYAPDFIINAGGVIQAASVHDYHDIDIANRKIDQLYDRLLSVFERAEREQRSTNAVAYQIAYENLRSPE